jgi:hypothetical protein
MAEFILRFKLRSRLRLLKIYVNNLNEIIFGDKRSRYHGLDAAINNYFQSFKTSKQLVEHGRDPEGCFFLLKICSYNDLKEINKEIEKYNKKIIKQSNKEKTLLFRFEELLAIKNTKENEELASKLNLIISQIKQDFIKIRDLNMELKHLIYDIRNQEQRINSYDNLLNIKQYIFKQYNIAETICHKLKMLEKKFKSWIEEVEQHENLNEILVKELDKRVK